MPDEPIFEASGVELHDALMLWWLPSNLGSLGRFWAFHYHGSSATAFSPGFRPSAKPFKIFEDV